MTRTRSVVDISFVISVKDRVPELRQTLASLYYQSHWPKEIIIVDDCSATPLTEAILPRPPHGVTVRILRNDINRGGAATCNRGVEAATNPIVAMMDSDDCLLPDAIGKIVNAWRRADAETICIAIGFFWCNNALLPYKPHRVTQPVTRDTLFRHGNFVGGSSTFSFRREAFTRVGGYPLTKGSHDWGLLMRLAAIGRIVTLTEPLMLYRSPSTNPLPTYTKSYRKQILSVRALYKMQTPEDRAILAPHTRRLLLGYLALWQRKRLAWRVMRSIIHHTGKVSPALLKPAFMLMVGSRAYEQLLFLYANARARVRGRALLRRYDYDPSILAFLERQGHDAP